MTVSDGSDGSDGCFRPPGPQFISPAGTVALGSPGGPTRSIAETGAEKKNRLRKLWNNRPNRPTTGVDGNQHLVNERVTVGRLPDPNRPTTVRRPSEAPHELPDGRGPRPCRPRGGLWTRPAMMRTVRHTDALPRSARLVRGSCLERVLLDHRRMGQANPRYGRSPRAVGSCPARELYPDSAAVRGRSPLSDRRPTVAGSTASGRRASRSWPTRLIRKGRSRRRPRGAAVRVGQGWRRTRPNPGMSR
jgi:hypothetical protein